MQCGASFGDIMTANLSLSVIHWWCRCASLQLISGSLSSTGRGLTRAAALGDRSSTRWLWSIVPRPSVGLFARPPCARQCYVDRSLHRRRARAPPLSLLTLLVFRSFFHQRLWRRHTRGNVAGMKETLRSASARRLVSSQCDCDVFSACHACSCVLITRVIS